MKRRRITDHFLVQEHVDQVRSCSINKLGKDLLLHVCSFLTMRDGNWFYKLADLSPSFANLDLSPSFADLSPSIPEFRSVCKSWKNLPFQQIGILELDSDKLPEEILEEEMRPEFWAICNLHSSCTQAKCKVGCYNMMLDFGLVLEICMPRGTEPWEGSKAVPYFYDVCKQRVTNTKILTMGQGMDNASRPIYDLRFLPHLRTLRCEPAKLPLLLPLELEVLELDINSALLTSESKTTICPDTLRTLALRCCDLSESIGSYFHFNLELEHLTLSTLRAPMFLKKTRLPHLSYLEIDCHSSYDDLPSLAHFTNLIELQIQNPPEPSVFDKLQPPKSLRRLHVLTRFGRPSRLPWSALLSWTQLTECTIWSSRELLDGDVHETMSHVTKKHLLHLDFITIKTENKMYILTQTTEPAFGWHIRCKERGIVFE